MIAFPELPGPDLAQHSARHLLGRGCSRSTVALALARWLELDLAHAEAITEAARRDRHVGAAVRSAS